MEALFSSVGMFILAADFLLLVGLDFQPDVESFGSLICSDKRAVRMHERESKETYSKSNPVVCWSFEGIGDDRIRSARNARECDEFLARPACVRAPHTAHPDD